MTLGYHSQKFSDRVRTMNQTRSKDLTLSADDARNLLHDIVTLLAKVAELSSTPLPQEKINIEIQGGGF